MVMGWTTNNSRWTLSFFRSCSKNDGNKKENRKRTKLVDFSERQKAALTNQKIKSLIDFDEQCFTSIKSLSIQKNTKIDLTTRFLNGKMLMFSKVSIKSFVYDIIDVFMFPNKEKFTKNTRLTSALSSKT